MSMNKLPTDRYVLECIFNMYKSKYPGAIGASGRPENDPYMAIDLVAVARKLGCTPELLFGRLYYYLNQKYRCQPDGGAEVILFAPKVGDKCDAVNFPYLGAILAGQNQDLLRFTISLFVSILAFVVSVASFIISVIK